MKDQYTQPRRYHSIDSFVSPMTRRRGANEHVQPFLRDLSPFPLPNDNARGATTFSTQGGLVLIETPHPHRIAREEEVGSTFKNIIDWGEQLEPQILSNSEQRRQNESSSPYSQSQQSSQQIQQEITLEKLDNPSTKKNQEEQHQQIPQTNHKKSYKSQSIQILSKKVTCNCKKTKCLKLYCDCFRINQICDGCNCTGCHNTNSYQEQRNNAILSLIQRNQGGFKPKIQGNQHSKGCNCKKSGCAKKYCQCFQAGLKCCELCKCELCKNKDECDGSNHPKKMTAKKESRFEQWQGV